MDSSEKAAPPAATEGAPKPTNWAAVAIVGVIVVAIAMAIFLPLANHSIEKAEPAKAFLRNHFDHVRKDPKALEAAKAEKPEPEREAAYAAIARSNAETMPWLPTVLGSEMAETLYCLEITLKGAKDEKVSVIVMQKWSEDKSTSTMKITGISTTRTCDCGENLEMGCMLN